MDGIAAIESNREALRRILAALVAMAGFSPAPALRRHAYLAILRLLRPAESATRRLIIALALTAMPLRTLPPQRPRKEMPKPGYIEIPASMVVRNGVGTGIILPPHVLRRLGPNGTVYLVPQTSPAVSVSTTRDKKASPRSAAFPLFDPLRDPFRRRWPMQSGVPRLAFPGQTQRLPVPARQPPSPDDQVDATRLRLRLAALGRALDDLPREARRFARWKALRDAAGAQERSRDAAGAQNGKAQGRIRRIWPLKPGRPPGGRLSHYDPSARNPPRVREVDEILAHAHALAMFALDKARSRPDTS